MKKLSLIIGLVACATSAIAQESQPCKPATAKVNLDDILKSGDTTGGRTFPDFQVTAIDYSKLDKDIASKLQEISGQELVIRKMSALSPDYKKAVASFREMMIDSLSAYYKQLDDIRKDTQQTLIPEYSKIKALKQAKEQDNTGSMEAAYQEELKRLTVIVRGLQDRNQTRYNTAIAALRNTERFNPKKVLTLRRLGYTKPVFYGTPIKQNTEVVLNEGCYDYRVHKGTQYEKSFSTYSYKYTVAVGDNVIKEVDPDDCVYKIHVERFLTDKFPAYQRSLSIPETNEVSPLLACESVSCVEMLNKDVAEWEKYVDQIAQDVSMDKILAGPDTPNSYWIKSKKDAEFKPIISSSLLGFAKKQFESPTITPNQENTMPMVGAQVLSKAAKSGAGLGAALVAAPALILDGVAGGVKALEKLLDNRYVTLSLDLKAPKTNSDAILKAARESADALNPNLATAIFDDQGADAVFGVSTGCPAVSATSDKEMNRISSPSQEESKPEHASSANSAS